MIVMRILPDHCRGYIPTICTCVDGFFEGFGPLIHPLLVVMIPFQTATGKEERTGRSQGE